MFVDARSETTQTLPAGMELLYTIRDQRAGVTRLQWSPDGRLLAVPSRDHRIRIHEADRGALIREIAAGSEAVLSVAWSPDSKTLASGGWDRTPRVWDVSSGRLIESLARHSQEINTVAWSPDGRTLATVCVSDEIQFWDTESWTRRTTISGRGGLHASWSPGGRLAVGVAGGDIRLWDPEVGRNVYSLNGHLHEAASVAWSNDSKILASGAKDGTVRLWDPEALELTRVLPQCNGQVIAVDILRNGVLLAAKCRDGSVRLWKGKSWSCVGLLEEDATDSGWCVGLAFHPSRPVLATLGGHDEHVRVWRLDLEILTSRKWDPDAS